MCFKSLVVKVDRKHLISPRGSFVEILSLDCAVTWGIDVRHLKVVTKVDGGISYPGVVCKEDVLIWIVVIYPITIKIVPRATEWLKCLDFIII